MGNSIPEGEHRVCRVGRSNVITQNKRDIKIRMERLGEGRRAKMRKEKKGLV